MRALTLWQPYASLVASGIKPVENRTWPVPSTVAQFIHGITYVPDDEGWLVAVPEVRIAIHAAKTDTDNDPTIPKMAWDALGDVIGGAPPPRGVLLATVALRDCHKAFMCLDESTGDLCSPWAGWRRPDRPFQAYWHWTFADPVALDEPIPMRGRQGLWNLPDDALAEVAA